MPKEKEGEEEGNKAGFFSRLKKGLRKTHDELNEKVVRATTLRMKLDDVMMEELEEALISSDIGMPTTLALIDSLNNALKRKDVTKPEDVTPFLRKEIEALASVSAVGQVHGPVKGSPHVILVVGVNGSGKTTTVGKLAHYHGNRGKSVILGASDTFRAAADEQLVEWSRRAGCDIVKHHPGSDPSAVAFDAIKAAVARKRDVLIVDTAGRLHTRTNLMEELKKIRKIIARELEGAPHETLLVVDGTTGQNTINQVREFNAMIPLTGIVITKLDGTSKGGAVVGIIHETKTPVKFLGIGEKIDDLQPFDPRLFAEALI
ncbi:MAG: signal recognition particle-docking protein FtsY [Nitrospinota bacterium]